MNKRYKVVIAQSAKRDVMEKRITFFKNSAIVNMQTLTLKKSGKQLFHWKGFRADILHPAFNTVDI